MTEDLKTIDGVEEATEEGEMHIELAPVEAFKIGDYSVPNSMTATVATTLILIVFALLVRRKAGVIPSRLQVLFEEMFMMFYEKLEEGLGEKRAKKIIPLIMTFFLFILVANQFILIPFASSIVTAEGGEFFRTPTTDYSLTLALGLIVMVAAHGIALFVSPLGHIGNYFRIAGFIDIIKGKRPVGELLQVFIELFLGFLEIIGDLIKVISLGSRLFGNIFAGEVVIIVISGLMFATQFIVPIPFIALAAFAGLIQAFVFALLSTLFISNNIIHASHQH